MSQNLKTFPDGPRGLQSLFIVLVSLNNPLGAARRIQTRYGDIAGVQFGKLKAVTLLNANLVHEVLVQKNNFFTKDQRYNAIPELLADGLLLSHGSEWIDQRRALQNQFSMSAILARRPLIDGCVSEYLSCIRPGTLAVQSHMKMLMAKLVYKTILGIDAPPEQTAKRLDYLLKYWDVRAFDQLFTLPSFVKARREQRFLAAVQDVRNEVDSAVAQVKQGTCASDLLGSFLAPSSCPHSESDDRTFRRVATFLLAGFDTSASFLSWLIWEVAKRPELQERILDENADDSASEASAQQPAGIIDAVMQEILRMYPPVWAFGREVLQPTSVGGYELEQGTQVLISPYLLHRDPRSHADPDEFKPERWLTDKELMPCVYMPFGAGPRLCIGRALALFQARLILVKILQRYRLSVLPGQSPRPKASITLHPSHELMVSLTPRH